VNIVLSILFSYSLSLCSSLNVRDKVSHPYRTTGKIIILYIRNSSSPSIEQWCSDRELKRIYLEYISDTSAGIIKSTVACMSDYRRGFRLEIGLIGHLNTRVATTLNYSATADLHISEFTTERTKSFQSTVSSPVFPW
jgi:hypothetical protein